MPAGDGTGPRGMGFLRGRGAGFCAGYPIAGFQNQGFGRGYGRGFAGLGFRGRRNRYSAGVENFKNFDTFTYNEITPEQEKEILINQANNLQATIIELNRRIKELEEISSQNNQN